MQIRRPLVALLAAAGLTVAGMAGAAPASALTGTFGVFPDHLAFLDPQPNGHGYLTVTLSLDPGYTFSYFDSYRIDADGTRYSSDFGVTPCLDAVPGADCTLQEDAISTTLGESSAWTEVIAECLSPGAGCRYLNLPVTVGPQLSRFLGSFQTSYDFGRVPVGTTVTRDIPVAFDPGYSSREGTAPAAPFDFDLGNCDALSSADCTMHVSVTPRALGSAHSQFGVDECTFPRVSCYDNFWLGVGLDVTGIAAATTTAISASVNPVRFGDPVTFTAHVATPSSLHPGGAVTFSDNGTAIGSSSIDATGAANVTVPLLQPGPHSITASYAGDALHTGSVSTALTETVTFDRCYSAGAGAIVVHAGQAVCVNGSRAGAVAVLPGGSLALIGAHLTGGVVATGARTVTMCGSTIAGAVSVTGSRGPVTIGDPSACASNTFAGALAVAADTGGVVIGGNTIRGALVCTGNNPPPTDHGHRNAVTGLRLGQCSAAGF